MAPRDIVARRSSYDETSDFIPTPPFATRAFYEYVAPKAKENAEEWRAWDPAAGHGHMTKVMSEYGHKYVLGTDINPHPGVMIQNFLDETVRNSDLILTNPPYALLEPFVLLGLKRAQKMLGLLVRVQALESQRRYASIFKKTPPTQIAIWADRIPFRVGKVVQKAPAMFTHIYLMWDKEDPTPQPPLWIPPGTKQRLEKDSDYN